MSKQVLKIKKTEITLTLEKALTTGQVAKMMGISARCVAQMFDMGRLSGYRLPTAEHKDRRFYLEDVLKFMQASGMRVPPELDNTAEIAVYNHDSDIPDTKFFANPIEFGAYLGNSRRCRIVIVGDGYGLAAMYGTIDTVRSLQPKAVIVSLYSSANAGAMHNQDKADLRYLLPCDTIAMMQEITAYVRPYTKSRSGVKLAST